MGALAVLLGARPQFLPQMNNSERRATPVSRAPLMGLDAGEIDALSREGVFHPMENAMGDFEKWMGVFRHGLTFMGAALVTLGIMDEAMWQQVSGALMVLVPVVWSWKAKA